MEALIVDHVHLVDIAVRMVLRRRRLPWHLTRDELASAARVGLVQAAKRFDASRGATFKTFALDRIHGSILDELRDQSPLSRAAWKKWLAGDESVRRIFIDIDSHPELEDEMATPASQDTDLDVNFEATPLRALLRRLPPREEKVCLFYYRDDLTMQEISDRIGVNESRVSQIHARAIRRLRTAMGVTHV